MSIFNSVTVKAIIDNVSFNINCDVPGLLKNKLIEEFGTIKNNKTITVDEAKIIIIIFL